MNYFFSCPKCKEDMPVLIELSQTLAYRVTCPKCNNQFVTCLAVEQVDDEEDDDDEDDYEEDDDDEEEKT